MGCEVGLMPPLLYPAEEVDVGLPRRRCGGRDPFCCRYWKSPGCLPTFPAPDRSKLGDMDMVR